MELSETPAEPRAPRELAGTDLAEKSATTWADGVRQEEEKAVSSYPVVESIFAVKCSLVGQSNHATSFFLCPHTLSLCDSYRSQPKKNFLRHVHKPQKWRQI